MRGQLTRIILLAGGCFLAACIVSAQADPSPPPASTTPSTPAPTPSATPVATASPTPRPGPPDMPSGKESVDRARAMDATFMTRTQLRGLEQIELGRIAAARASNSDVREFGQQIVQDRGKANEELRLFAQGQSIALPTVLEAKRRTEIDRISKLSSPALDREIVRALVKLHDADVADFQNQTQMGQEVELQGWVYVMLPSLEEQQAEIHRIADELGISAAGP